MDCWLCYIVSNSGYLYKCFLTTFLLQHIGWLSQNISRTFTIGLKMAIFTQKYARSVRSPLNCQASRDLIVPLFRITQVKVINCTLHSQNSSTVIFGRLILEVQNFKYQNIEILQYIFIPPLYYSHHSTFGNSQSQYSSHVELYTWPQIHQ